MPAVACPFCGSDHPDGTFVCPNTNRRLQGLLPTGTSIEGKYRIEVRNTTLPAYAETFDLKARDEVTIRHRFQ